MPFVSKAQRKFLWAKHPEIAKRWTAEHGSGGTRLPEHVKALKQAAKERNHA